MALNFWWSDESEPSLWPPRAKVVPAREPLCVYMDDDGRVVVVGDCAGSSAPWGGGRNGAFILAYCQIEPGDDIDTLKESMLHLTRMHYAGRLG